jgi:putative phage-type endonuclease
MKPFLVIDCEQRTPAWFQARAGRLTASCAKDMLATIKAGEAAARRDLRVRLVVERLTGEPEENGYINEAMQWGIDHEDDAFAAYEALTGDVVQRSGFLSHPELMAGASLDGHIGDFDGVLEIKCPKKATHFGYLRASAMPAEHLAQVTHALWISGAEFCDFFSFDPRFPAHMRTFLHRVNRTDVDIDAYAAKAKAFLAEVDREYSAALGWKVLEQEIAING